MLFCENGTPSCLAQASSAHARQLHAGGGPRYGLGICVPGGDWEAAVGTAAIRLLGYCSMAVPASGNEWQAVYHCEGLQSCTATEGAGAPKVPQDYQLLG